MSNGGRGRFGTTGRARHDAISGCAAVALTLALGMSLGGCEGMLEAATHDGTMIAGVATIVSVTTTDKTIPDHVVSLALGQDCSLVRHAQGGYYCVRPLPDNTPVETRLYCYKSLAGITCYDQAVPGEEGRLVTDPRHVVSSRDIAGPMVGPRPGQQ